MIIPLGFDLFKCGQYINIMPNNYETSDNGAAKEEGREDGMTLQKT